MKYLLPVFVLYYKALVHLKNIMPQNNVLSVYSKNFFMKLHGLRRKHIPRICLSTSLYFVVIFALLVLSIIKLWQQK